MCDMKALGDDESAKNSYLQTFNSIRQDWANKYQIANMHEMSYDYDLEKIARKLTCSTMMRPGPNYMPAAFPDEQSLKLILTVDLKKQEEAVMNLFGGMGHPENSGMACVMFDPPCSGTGGQVPIACIAGPKTSLSSWDFKKGPPGSQCPNGKTNGGLTADQRLAVVTSREWCTHCMTGGHQITQCYRNKRRDQCRYCGLFHHKSLCPTHYSEAAIAEREADAKKKKEEKEAKKKDTESKK
ncbi:hypothetical protein CAEBREN_25258 [Caenorhabditis brenneri]|uniref:Uncharacterized protein n=1 Tax=Caenorhabditis brenneri TaxID=135651 RepID=G0MR83_CAEBE|nr:hypothetical protein CAEBREN_25258 [Caenorhabditis brenneri]